MLKELGISPIINAHGTPTVFGGCVLEGEIIDAMKDASQSLIDGRVPSSLS